MSLERAGEYVIEFLNDEEAGERADMAFLRAVADTAAERGYDVTTDEIREAFRSLASMDGDDVEGFNAWQATVTVNTGTFANSASAFNSADSFNTATGARVGNWANFSPLGFMRG